MFYCDACAERSGWPKTIYRSHGPCEVCGQTRDCSDMPSKNLPLPGPERGALVARQDMMGEWLRTGSHSFCPACGSPDVRVRQVLEADSPQGALAGGRVKFTMHAAWEYRCFACGDTGPAAIREPLTGRATEGHDPDTCPVCQQGRSNEG